MRFHIPLGPHNKKFEPALKALPFGIGLKFVLPTIRWILDVFVRRLPIVNFKKKKFAKREMIRIRHQMNKGAKKAIIVYDLSCSPASYGDYLKSISLGRYFQAFGLKLEFYIINSEFREEWEEVLNREEIHTLVEEFFKLAVNLLHQANMPIIRCISWAELKKISPEWDTDSVVVPFLNNVKNRIATYHHTFNLLNYLLKKLPPAQLNKILFSYEQIKPLVKIDEPDFPYVTWNVRYFHKWGLNRNTTDEEFREIYTTLIKRFPHHMILIVSDEGGCKHFREASKKFGMPVKFSKDYSESFLGDMALVLNSKYYFQLRGGGMGIVPMFSLMPYSIVISLISEAKWKPKQATSWQTKSQIFLFFDPVFHEDMIPSYLDGTFTFRR